MTVNIALFLSSDGIALAHRQKAGHWAMIGETAFDVPDLSTPLAALRAQAVEREGDDFETLLVLPDDQILYTSLTVPTGDDELTAFRIEDGLEGLTPYSVTELEYAWEELEQDRVKIAVVARETLDEASNFAKQYGFVTKGFAAMPPMERFPGVPTFDLGDEAAGMGFTADGIAFGPDRFGLPEPEPEPVVEEPVVEEVPAPAEAAVDAPTDETVQDPPEPAEAPEPEPTPEPHPPSENAALADALGVSPEAADPVASQDTAQVKAAAFVEPSEDPSPLQGPVVAIQDPTVTGPIQSIAADVSEPDAVAPAEIFGDAGDDDDVLPPVPSPAARVARERARVIRGDTSTAPSAADANPTPPGTRVQRPAAAGPMPTSDPNTEFAASRGRVAAPDTDRDSLVGQRGSRIGLSQPGTPSRAAPSVTSPEPAEAPSARPMDDASPMPRLAEQLKRVRSASKTKPKGAADLQPPRARVEIDPQPQLGQTGALAERRPSPFDNPPPSAQNAVGAGLLGRLAGIRQKSGPAAKASPTQPLTPAQAPDAPLSAASDTADADAPRRFGLGRSTKSSASGASTAPGETGDESFASGMLARKVTAPAGGSFRTGLVLTAILLLLLIFVAIWAAIFLPNSSVARWFGGGTEQVSALPPATGLQAPDVGTSAPVIGTIDGAEPSLVDEAAADGMVLDGEGAITLEADAEGALEVAAITPEIDTQLPDIDADLDLPPLPPIDQGLNPSPEEAEALYAEDGIWARSPDRPDLRPFDLMDRVYTASIDPQISAFDAIALPDPGVDPGELLRRFPPPPAFGAAFDLTDSGLVAPTPDGVLTPEGAFVILGQPSRLPLPRPREIASEVPVIDAEAAVLGTFRPAERPGDLAETRERQVLNGFTEAELADVRPTSRPDSPQETAAQASLFPAASTDPDAVNEAVREAIAGTELAVARSLMPRTRPANITQIVASADRTPTEQPTAVAASAVAAGPSIPSNADVSRAATERNAIRLRNVNLIGVNGSSSDRRALVRLASGRFVRVNVGDRLDGGRVAAIGETTLQYVRSGRTVTLEIPG